jgi:hypothetical protein
MAATVQQNGSLIDRSFTPLPYLMIKAKNSTRLNFICLSFRRSSRASNS